MLLLSHINIQISNSLYLIAFLRLAVCFEITLYISHLISPIRLLLSIKYQAGGGGQGQGELLIKIASKVDKLLETKNVSSKDGSTLNAECVACFGAVLVSRKNIVIRSTDKCFDQVKELVRNYTTQMRDFYVAGVMDEVAVVQPHSFQLFREISLIVLSDYADDLRFECKKSNHVDTKYTTTLYSSSGKIINISGETDSTMLYCGISISTWEDKSLDKSAKSVKEIGQPLAEVKGMAELFKARVGREAPKFFGVLTTGLVWTMSSRDYSNGNVTFANTDSINAWNEPKDAIDDEGLNIITSFLLASLRSAEVLIKIIDEKGKRIMSSVEDYPDTDDLPDDDDGDNDGDNDGDDECDGNSGGGNGGGSGGSGDVKAVLKSFSKMSTRSNTKSNTEKNEKSHGKRRTPLTPINASSIISFENMNKHDNYLQCMKDVEQCPMQRFRDGLNKVI